MRTPARAALLGALMITMLGSGAAQAASGPPVGKRLSCYSTYASSGSPTGYGTTLRAALTLHRSGPIRYQVSYSALNRNSPGEHVAWTASHGVLSFRRGFFGKGAAGINVVGHYYSQGATMAHSQLTAAKYTVVLRSKGTPVNDDAPPRTQGTDFRKASWWYCTTGKPTFKSQGGGSTGTTPTPTPAPTPAPAPVASGPHPPYGTYTCKDKAGYATDAFTLSDPLTYADTSSGTFSFDTASGRIDFHGGRYDENVTGWHLYGTFSAPGTIVVAATAQTTYGGPDADEAGAHSFWHCTLM